MELTSEEAIKLVWDGAIPLQIRLHESEITTLPSPPPIMVTIFDDQSLTLTLTLIALLFFNAEFYMFRF